MDRRPDHICLWENRPHLSIWPPRLHPTDGSLSSILVPSSISKKKSENTSNLQKRMATAQSLSMLGLMGVKWRMVCQRKSLPEGGNMWRTFFFFISLLSRRLPHTRFHRERLKLQWLILILMVHPLLFEQKKTFGNSLKRSATFLGKRPHIWQQPQAPVIAPSHPHFHQMTELSNLPASQLITATIGN